MGPSYSIDFAALTSLEMYFKALPDVANQSASIALNDVMGQNGKGTKLLRQMTQQEVNFPNGYVDDEKIKTISYAAPDHLEVHIQARKRATSLARFATSRKPATTKAERDKGVTVAVHRGKQKTIRSGFLIRLRSGASLTEDNYNIGLAVRLKPGETLKNKKQVTQGNLKGLYLLYGPSVEQVVGEVVTENEDPILNLIAAEFVRQVQFRSEKLL